MISPCRRAAPHRFRTDPPETTHSPWVVSSIPIRPIDLVLARVVW